MIGQSSLFIPDASAPLRQRVQVELISLKDARYALTQFHYLHRVRVGRQLNYAVLIDGVVDGVITYAYAMVSVPIAGVPSDEFIEFARMYLHQNIPHSATCAIGKTLRTVASDWVRTFPDAKRPRLVVSWSDTTLHKGTVYKAANFEWLKRSKGQPHGNSETSKRGSRVAHGDYSNDKDCWIYPLKATRS
jgi:hypothetical protein